MACTECLFGFFFDPIKVGISLTSLLLSVTFFFLMRRQLEPQKKALLIYAHLFTLIFPIVYYLFTNSCMMVAGGGFCNSLRPALTIFFVTLLSSIIIGYLLTPLILRLSPKTSRIAGHMLESFVVNEARKAHISEPTLHLIDTARPIAFCVSILKPRIYLSMGMAELLSQKEIEAVLLHELGHIKHRSSWLKFSTYLQRLTSPFSVFADLNSALCRSEHDADAFAIGEQGTATHLLRAKRKVERFERLF